ncbi:hypothetical protein [Janibacter melonis]|uniref:hypothetical protein n=1 Tax=Janibacter melonis TaxID=262209 RepID=UPI00191ADB80|nr:hypothetical protein [Janibacter melonis]
MARTLSARSLRTARAVAYRCRRHTTFRVIWPEVDAPLVHPCPSCGMASLRLIGTRPDSVSA